MSNDSKISLKHHMAYAFFATTLNDVVQVIHCILEVAQTKVCGDRHSLLHNLEFPTMKPSKFY